MAIFIITAVLITTSDYRVKVGEKDNHVTRRGWDSQFGWWGWGVFSERNCTTAPDFTTNFSTRRIVF